MIDKREGRRVLFPNTCGRNRRRLGGEWRCSDGDAGWRGGYALHTCFSDASSSPSTSRRDRVMFTLGLFLMFLARLPKRTVDRVSVWLKLSEQGNGGRCIEPGTENQNEVKRGAQAHVHRVWWVLRGDRETKVMGRASCGYVRSCGRISFIEALILERW